MKIRFFGHSIFKYRKYDTSNYEYDTFSTNILKRYGCEYVDDRVFGAANCSEERILFYLKKTKDMDVAIIAHVHPSSVFCISSNKDFAQGIIAEDEYEYYESRDQTVACHADKLNAAVDERDLIAVDWKELNRNLLTMHQLAYHPDLQMNRYCGALVQIDSYLSSKQIPAIHLVNPQHIPPWFRFNSGIVDPVTLLLQYTPPHCVSYSQSPNALSEEANRIVEERLISYIASLTGH